MRPSLSHVPNKIRCRNVQKYVEIIRRDTLPAVMLLVFGYSRAVQFEVPEHLVGRPCLLYVSANSNGAASARQKMLVGPTVR